MSITTLMFDWRPPQGSGPETVVDYYTVFISPSPPSRPSYNVVSSPPWNVTLSHNVVYSVNITATNCAGESEVVAFPEIEYGEYRL